MIFHIVSYTSISFLSCFTHCCCKPFILQFFQPLVLNVQRKVDDSVGAVPCAVNISETIIWPSFTAWDLFLCWLSSHLHVETRNILVDCFARNAHLGSLNYRFRSDSLYICDWPGCAHQGQKRVYNLFRGIFKNFQHSHVFRNLKDLKAKRTEIRCAFCSEGTYDMVTSFCLRRSFEYHEDGEPVIRAYVCESGHVVGAWTDRPLYNM